MLKTEKIAGVVVLFSPDPAVSENISSYIEQLDCLYIIDNSETSNESIVKQFTGKAKIKYFHFNENIGIAKALNIAVQNAINDGYSLLLTMDQDSTLSRSTIDEYRRYIELPSNDRIGILTLHQRVKNFIIHRLDDSTENVHTAFTSGSLLNLEAFANIGPFDEKLFIDYVDHEYCLRLKKNGYRIVRLNSIYCDHQLGSLESRKVFGLTIPITHHSAVRYYYRTRNRMLVAKNYFKTFPMWILMDIIRFFYEVSIILFFETGKIIKSKMILKGINDFLHGRYGKI